MIIYFPAWSNQLMEVSIVPANSIYLAPFPGVKQNGSPVYIDSNNNHDDDNEEMKVSTANQYHINNYLYESLQSISTCKLTTSFYKLKARRKLLSSYFVADALHQLAWKSQLTIPETMTQFKDISKQNPVLAKKLNLAYFQVSNKQEFFYLFFSWLFITVFLFFFFFF